VRNWTAAFLGPSGARLACAGGRPAAVSRRTLLGAAFSLGGCGLWPGEAGGTSGEGGAGGSGGSGGATVQAIDGRPLSLALTEGRRVEARDGQIALLAADGQRLRVQPCADLRGDRRGLPVWMGHHTGRRSVLAAFAAFDEFWELPLDGDAPPVFDGLVHDWRMAEAIAKPGWFTPRRMPMVHPMPLRWWLHPAWPWVAGAFDDQVWILHLDVRRVVARLPWRVTDLAASQRMMRDGSAVWQVPTREGWRRMDGRRFAVVPDSGFSPGSGPVAAGRRCGCRACRPR
jgi:hypothetical protein